MHSHISLDVLAEALADRTRRDIYSHVAHAETPLTASELGQEFGVHRTVARSHLERLVDAGLLESAVGRRPAGGRPPKIYFQSANRLDVQIPRRDYEMLAGLLVATLRRFGDAAPLLAREVGFKFGRGLAADTEGNDPPGGATLEGLSARLEPLRSAGAEITVHREDGRLLVDVGNCLFQELAAKDPLVVCSLDRALIRGLLSSDTHSWACSENASEPAKGCRLTLESIAPQPF